VPKSVTLNNFERRNDGQRSLSFTVVAELHVSTTYDADHTRSCAVYCASLDRNYLSAHFHKL